MSDAGSDAGPGAGRVAGPRDGEIIRFLISGGTSTGIYIAVMALAAAFPVVPLSVASVGAYGMSMVVNYLMQKFWTFKSGRRHREAIPRYVMTHLGGIVLNAGILFFFAENLGLPLIPVQLASFVVIAAWSYTFQKIWVFTHR